MHRVFLRDGLKQSFCGWTTQSLSTPRSYRTRPSTERGHDREAQTNHKSIASHATSEATEAADHRTPPLDGTPRAPSNGIHAPPGADGASGEPAHASRILPPSTQFEGSEPSLKGVSNQHARKGAKYRRHIPRLKRFPPLLEEIKKHGLKDNAGRPTNSLDRSVVSTPTLQEELRWLAQTSPHPKAIRNTLEVLIRDRKEKPDSEYYRVLILGNCFPELGSVDNVKTILQQMEREDTYLRTAILQRLAQQWVSKDKPEFQELNVVALVREGQLELATIELQKMQQKGVLISNWVWVIYIHAVCDSHDFNTLLQLLYKLYDSDFPFPRPTLLHILIKAGKPGDLALTKWIWYTYVENMHIIPDEAICMDVLRLATMKSDIELAESVAVVLESVAGNTSTTPPSLDDLPPLTRHEIYGLAFDSPILPGHPRPANPKDEPDMASSDARAIAFSTPPVLPSPRSPPPLRNIPEEAVELLREVRADPRISPDRRRKNPAVLYKLFREESGLRGARFDPLLALKQGWDWRKK
ncbi:hypothetical protein LTR10_013587 [Elasticomyces elasticus]|uniref:Pentatricopeptide repeat protein n=1 Tax=Exophiala sideris TaxID=1016849 RepID=A0ABR0JQ38_9EURO|nr:hypothetical protein LTR10_013587 [Elasticomyces elasticus]KAK5039725.1 hypothetical protein LTS07_000220 [Exophiala sideris]KAK5041277.1 hypothetical protein LTR13_002752 [Exophiala sideris]KAK5068103.1 hypothetical protein LTR69_000221 [Exophiala sideris]KAK5187404.1 hypothetical protein LTR44_000220 [Eurotiomycetes sp. CCFEE 6388]